MKHDNSEVYTMKFYDREQELAFLRETRETAKKVARFTVVTKKYDISHKGLSMEDM